MTYLRNVSDKVAKGVYAVRHPVCLQIQKKFEWELRKQCLLKGDRLDFWIMSKMGGTYTISSNLIQGGSVVHD